MGAIPSARRSNALRVGAVASAVAVAVSAAHAASLVVPTDRFVEVRLTQSLSSATAHVGDPFAFATTKDVTLGTIVIPKGTPGHGRLAIVRAAAGNQQGEIALQADSIDLPDGDTIWVNVDPRSPARGHLADRHTKPVLLPPLFGAYVTTTTGNMILDEGATFGVLTIAPRTVPAALLTAPPTPVPTPTPAASPMADASPTGS